MNALNERDSAEVSKDRELSEVTVALFPRLSRIWRLSKAEQLSLIGCDLEDRNQDLLDDETIGRMGYLIGVFSFLNTLYPDKHPYDLVRETDTPLFKDKCLLDVMSGGLEGLVTVYKILEREVEGNPRNETKTNRTR